MRRLERAQRGYLHVSPARHWRVWLVTRALVGAHSGTVQLADGPTSQMSEHARGLMRVADTGGQGNRPWRAMWRTFHDMRQDEEIVRLRLSVHRVKSSSGRGHTRQPAGTARSRGSRGGVACGGRRACTNYAANTRATAGRTRQPHLVRSTDVAASPLHQRLQLSLCTRAIRNHALLARCRHAVLGVDEREWLQLLADGAIGQAVRSARE